jgi:photosystem II stability/assembly factor-like uncharacterized protein
MRVRTRPLALLATIVAVATLATPDAQTLPRGDQLQLEAMRWRNIGPFRGGRATAAVGVPSQPLVYYFGATGGGVWKTEDAGLSWRNVSDGFFQTGSVGALAVAESDPNVVYAGMGEACVRSNFAEGDGVYRSTDGGATWSHAGLATTRQIGRIRIDPRDPHRVYVAALGNVFGPSRDRGVYRSTDGGKNWQQVLFVNERAGAVDLAMNPANSRVLYAATWEVTRTPWNLSSGGTGGGLYKSTDGGDTWTPLTRGLPQGMKGRIGVTVSPVRPDRMWAIVEAEDGGVFRSDDGGSSWTRTNGDSVIRERAWYYSHIHADTQNVDTVYVLTLQINKSTDGGRTFDVIRPRHVDNHDLWLAPDDNRRIINANDGGVNVSFNGGQTWTTQDNQPTGQFYHVTTDAQFPYRIYGAQQDNSTVSIPSQTAGSGIEAQDWFAVGGGESGHIAPDPRNPDIVYAGSYYGLLTRHDRKTSQLRNIAVWPESPGGRAAGAVKYRFQWTFPIVISPHDPGTLYTAANVLFRSTNEGQSWEPISPDLTRNDKSTLGPSGGPLTGDNSSADYYGTIFTVAESPVARGVIWTGSDDGLVHVTRDGGKNWHNVTPAALGPWSRVNELDASPHDAGTAYLAVNRYQMDDRRPYIYRTRDFGKTWTLIVSGIAEQDFVRAVRQDPERKELLYAGTEHGVYLSVDDGARWQSLALNMPAVPITDLDIRQGDLVAATQGRGFWILDDLSPLRQGADARSTSSIHLFTPQLTYRVQGGGRGRSEVSGENPPSGAIVYFRLPDSAPSAVTLEFRDSRGELIRSFTSGDRAPLRAGPGLNRFVWDLRYPDAVPPPAGTTLFGGTTRGPVAPPGAYEVRLVAGSETRSARLQVVRDPRVAADDEDLRAQFDLLISIRDAVSAAHTAVEDILRAREELDAVSAKAASMEGAEGIAARAREIDAALGTVQAELIEMRLKTGNDVLSYAIKLNARIASIAPVVASAESRPTDQSRAVFAELSTELDRYLERLRDIFATDVAALNTRTRQLGLPHVSSGAAAARRPASKSR